MSINLYNEKINVEGWVFLIVSPDTVLYHSGNKQLDEVDYFTDEKTAKNNGIFSSYITSNPLKLLDMYDLNNLAKLYSSAPESVKYSITKSFGYSLDEERINRKKDNESDILIIRYICSVGLDGMAHEGILGTIESNYPEIVLCDPIDKLDRVEKTIKSEDNNKKQSKKLHLFYI